MKIILTCGIVAATALIVAPAMQAQQPVTMALSTVGDPGNAAPGNSWADRTLANEANYYSFSGGYTLPGTSGYLTPVGAFTDSESYYGTYDQAGDVQNWNDAVLYEFCRGIHGDDWSNTMFNLSSSRRSFGPPTSMGEVYETGFRVANVPEPSSIMLTGLGGILAVALRRKPSR